MRRNFRKPIKLEKLTGYFQKQFFAPEQEKATVYPLINLVKPLEVKKVKHKLKNNKATGPDMVEAEYLKQMDDNRCRPFV